MFSLSKFHLSSASYGSAACTPGECWFDKYTDPGGSEYERGARRVSLMTIVYQDSDDEVEEDKKASE
jgi:hypothetical protein